MAINFHFNQTSKPSFFKSNTIKSWLNTISRKEGFTIIDLNFIFLTDKGLLKINIDYLNHDTYTDIITFDNSSVQGKIESDIFISLERVQENAKQFNTTFENELNRVMAHGFLHLCGYKDKTKEDKIKMRQKEEDCLQLL